MIEDKMNYYFTGILVILFCLLTLVGPAYSGSTQTNTSGSNTAIEGGYTSTATTTYQSMTQDVCAVGASAGIQTFGVGVSAGKHFIDKNCERLKLARILNDFGMKVAAVAILCQDERVFESMIQAGTPCPIDGKIGKEAKALWSKYDHERPDYDIYVKRMKERERKEKAIAKKKALEEKKNAKEQAKMTKEFDEFDKQVEKKIEQKKKDINWESPK
jgi:hypothetical protein